MTPICPELLYARKIGSNFEGRPFVKYQILEIMRNVKTFFETLTINVLEFKISPALKKHFQIDDPPLIYNTDISKNESTLGPMLMMLRC